MQKDMVTILNAEGFEVSERELMRVRSKHRLLLRSANGGGKPGTDDSRLSTANVQGLDEEVCTERSEFFPNHDLTLLQGHGTAGCNSATATNTGAATAR